MEVVDAQAGTADLRAHQGGGTRPAMRDHTEQGRCRFEQIAQRFFFCE
jgi:hypothetical protein